MKNINMISLILFLSACSSIPIKDGEISYTELNDSLITINISEPNQITDNHKEEIYSNLTRGINYGWPDLKAQENTEINHPKYCLHIEIVNYGAKFDTDSSVETISNKKVYYTIYKTITYLDFRYELINIESSNTVWSKEVSAIDTIENKVEDNCHSSNFIKELACEIIIEPVVDSVIDSIFTPYKNPDYPYKPPTSYEKMFFKAGKAIGKTLPKPNCSKDGYPACITHFLRNT